MPLQNKIYFPFTNEFKFAMNSTVSLALHKECQLRTNGTDRLVRLEVDSEQRAPVRSLLMLNTAAAQFKTLVAEVVADGRRHTDLKPVPGARLVVSLTHSLTRSHTLPQSTVLFLEDREKMEGGGGEISRAKIATSRPHRQGGIPLLRFY